VNTYVRLYVSPKRLRAFCNYELHDNLKWTTYIHPCYSLESNTDTVNEKKDFVPEDSSDNLVGQLG
jgi:hypothetical protein